MVFVGIVLAAAAVGAGVGIVSENTAPASLSAFGRHIPGVSTQAHVFISGAVLALVFVAGLAIATLSLGRSIRVRRELRDLREEHRESLTELELEKRQLERELARARNVARQNGMPAAGGRPPAAGEVPPMRPNSISPESPFFERP